MSSSNAQQNGSLQRVSSDEAIKRMSRMMLEGWAMTGTICPVEECGNSVPLLRDRQDRLFCTRCNCYIQYSSREEQQQSSNRGNHDAEDHTALNGQPTEDSYNTYENNDNDDDQISDVNREVAEFRSHISNVASRQMGPMLLQGYRMLSETCDVPGCSSPILEKQGRKTCVMCPDWKPPEQREPGYFARIVLSGNDYKNPPPSLARYVSTSTVGNVRNNESPGSTNPWQDAVREVTSHMQAAEREDEDRNVLNEGSRVSADSNSRVDDATSESLGNTVVRDAPTNWREMSDEQLSAYAQRMRPPAPPETTQDAGPSTASQQIESNQPAPDVPVSQGTEQRYTMTSGRNISSARTDGTDNSFDHRRWGKWESTQQTALESIDYTITQVSQELRNVSSSLGAQVGADYIKTVTTNITMLTETLARLREVRRNYEE